LYPPGPGLYPRLAFCHSWLALHSSTTIYPSGLVLFPFRLPSESSSNIFPSLLYLFFHFALCFIKVLFHSLIFSLFSILSNVFSV
jgi:hypothetical protein